MPNGARLKVTRWTEDEDEVIRARYPAGGVAACLSWLYPRSLSAIEGRAHHLGVYRDARKALIDHRALARALGTPAARIEISGARLVKRLT